MCRLYSFMIFTFFVAIETIYINCVVQALHGTLVLKQTFQNLIYCPATL